MSEHDTVLQTAINAIEWDGNEKQKVYDYIDAKIKNDERITTLLALTAEVVIKIQSKDCGCNKKELLPVKLGLEKMKDVGLGQVQISEIHPLLAHEDESSPFEKLVKIEAPHARLPEKTAYEIVDNVISKSMKNLFPDSKTPIMDLYKKSLPQVQTAPPRNMFVPIEEHRKEIEQLSSDLDRLIAVLDLTLDDFKKIEWMSAFIQPYLSEDSFQAFFYAVTNTLANRGKNIRMVVDHGFDGDFAPPPPKDMDDVPFYGVADE